MTSPNPILNVSVSLHQVRLLLSNSQTDVNRGKSDGTTALMLAAANGQTKVVELLLRHPKIQVNNQGQDFVDLVQMR